MTERRVGERRASGNDQDFPKLFDSVIPPRKPLLDGRQIVTSLLLMLPAAIIAVVVSYFAQKAEVQALTISDKRQEQAIAQLESTDRERIKQDAETVTRLEAVIRELDKLVARIERMEEKR